jgi:NADH-quinone oxidoreductase subunit L
MNLWLIPFFPLIGCLLNGLLGKRFTKPVINLIAAGSVAASFLYVVFALTSLSPLNAPHVEHYYTWIQSGFLNVGVDFLVDRLTAVMLLVVTGVGLLIHIYAIGYMEHEGGYYRFFAYLNLFMFFMLVLVQLLTGGFLLPGEVCR